MKLGLRTTTLMSISALALMTLANPRPSFATDDPAKPAAKPAAAKPAVATAAASTVPAASSATSAAMTPEEENNTIYALGLMLARNLQTLDLTPAEVKRVVEGINDGTSGKATAIKIEDYAPKVKALGMARQEKRAVAEKAKGASFLAAEAAKPGVVKSESGMLYTETLAGTGASPAATDKVKVHYRGTTIDGKEFDSSIARGTPAEFPLNGVIKCWTEGVQKMKVGGKARLVCPAELAYGDRAQPNIPAGSTLIFDVELLDIVK
ncbi:MAG: FKBP-type peptidyl-prolyl cis-trans isomerase [Thermoanaerobaculia bacterium]